MLGFEGVISISRWPRSISNDGLGIVLSLNSLDILAKSILVLLNLLQLRE